MKNAEVLLRFVLRWVGSVALIAIVAVVMPYAWMDAIHRALGMGPLPDQPVVGYLARSLSAFYAMFGGMLWRLSFDVRRYRPVLGYIGVATVVFGLTLIGIDWLEGMPGFWKMGEGPITVLLGVILLVLLRNIRETQAVEQEKVIN